MPVLYCGHCSHPQRTGKPHHPVLPDERRRYLSQPQKPKRCRFCDDCAELAADEARDRGAST